MAAQQGTHKYINYFDIMVIGKTGMGKSTTAEKILIANPLEKKYLGEPYQDPTHDDENGHIQYGDMFMWHLSNKPNEIERVTEKLKNLVFYRSLSHPHKEVNQYHEKGYESTEQCELFSNDTTKIRVLDVPGFYGSEASCSSNIRERAMQTANNDLSIMRKILHIKIAKKFKFNRIMYFLPEKGALERDSQILQTEIGIMENYFGRSIFESMVVIATHSANAYKFFPKDRDLFPSEDIEKTRYFFHKAMIKVFGTEDVPTPPIVFISLFDTCEEVYSKIRDCKVSKEGVELRFNPSTCARCSIKIGTLKEDEYVEERDGDRIRTCTRDNDWSHAIPYEDSTCHPMMIPKYTKLQKIVGGIAHLITFKIFWGKWPSFKSLDEMCIKCGECPKTRGCVKVNTTYTNGSGEIKVDHTSTVIESYVIQMESDDKPPMQDDEEERVPLVGPKVFLPDSSVVTGYTGSINASFLRGQRGEGDGGEKDGGEEGLGKPQAKDS